MIRASVDPIAPVRIEYDGRAACCPRCDETLERHQPDEACPERILGVCSGCSAWYLVDEGWGLLYPLPEVWRASGGGN